MDINYWAVLVCAVLAMVIGHVWHGPLFGKKFMQAMGFVMPTDPAAMKEAMKGMWKMYVSQFILVLFQVYVLVHYILGWKEASGVTNALWIWAGFVIPTMAGLYMWSNKSKKDKWTLFLIGAGYQLVLFVVFGFILGSWR